MSWWQWVGIGTAVIGLALGAMVAGAIACWYTGYHKWGKWWQYNMRFDGLTCKRCGLTEYVESEWWQEINRVVEADTSPSVPIAEVIQRWSETGTAEILTRKNGSPSYTLPPVPPPVRVRAAWAHE